jgi:hypothetical protein
VKCWCQIGIVHHGSQCGNYLRSSNTTSMSKVDAFITPFLEYSIALNYGGLLLVPVTSDILEVLDHTAFEGF